ncbi:hypothetical protein DOTSEDRAFT_58612 [Dothistroma septosporum NZE10]|uniref:Uncharacterized protein n=1 Tax=Dothistroma septosporum (strain NZE10 / CBS 128990) TaxID=675120 RepID=N1Q0S5_DOTSN|nr:hypothetical protein DOTSEDRAFT_58612 [Dothistroma septosporum NZE10]
MPSASLSPHAPASGAISPASAQRPALMKRQSSQSSNQSTSRPGLGIASPGGSVEAHGQILRHPVKTRHAKIVLPRNHSSGRNLAKLNRQAQQAQNAIDDGRKHSRQRSHEGDTEIRLPGSLDDSVQQKPQMRRNMTSYQLPRNTSHVKLKKNLSHGQLTRLGSGRNLVALGEARQRAPPSPGLKGKSKRPKSAEMTGVEKDLRESEVELSQQQQREKQRKFSGTKSKKVGFAVGSAGDASDEDETVQLGGHEDEWTEESASASPYSTRQNTANNSRRTSAILDRPAEKLPFEKIAVSEKFHLGRSADKQDAIKMERERQKRQEQEQEQEQEQQDDDESDDSGPPSPRSTGHAKHHAKPHQQEVKEQPAPQNLQLRPKPREEDASEAAKPVLPPLSKPVVEAPKGSVQQLPSPQGSVPKSVSSSLHVTKDAHPSTRRLLNRSQQYPSAAPAVVSNVSALDDVHSNRGSPAPSMKSSKSTLDAANDQQEDELVSRFVPSASHPSTGSGANTAANTPKQSGFHTPEEDSTLAAQRREKNVSGFQIGPVSPGSTISAGSSGANTPAIGRSRTELRMLQDKAMVEIADQAGPKPHLPAHIFDRRNESLKSYLNNIAGEGRGQSTGLSMGPDVFQGRFRALNTELRVVQKFRDPIGEAVIRLRGCKGSKLHQHASKQASQHKLASGNGLSSSKSAISLPAQRARQAGDLSKSASPPKVDSTAMLKRGIAGAQGEVRLQNQGGSERQKPHGRREVSFAGKPETREFEPAPEEMDPSEIARQLWGVS